VLPFRCPAVADHAAVLLDALGTLVALEPPAPRLRLELADRFGLSVSVSEAERAIGAEISYYRAHLDEGFDRESVDDLRRRCGSVLGDALGVSFAVTDALLASLTFTVFDDVVPALRALRAGGTRLVVASNWDWSLHEVLSRVGLEGLVDGVVTSAEVGARKPAVAVFERALAVAGVPAARAIHVGDSFEEDIVGARAAGVEPVLIRRDGGVGGSLCSGVRTVSSLRELVDF
jgi:putative hydrolase of the HAD superfamily